MESHCVIALNFKIETETLSSNQLNLLSLKIIPYYFTDFFAY